MLQRTIHLILIKKKKEKKPKIYQKVLYDIKIAQAEKQLM